MTTTAAAPLASAKQPRGLGSRFYGLFTATGISSTGDGLVAVALPLLALTLTRNPLAIAGVTAVSKGATALVCLPAGVMADRVGRRRMMIACNLLAGAVLLGLVLAMSVGRADLAMVYLVAAVLAMSDVTYNLAMQGVFPDVIGSPEHLGVANGRLSSMDGAGEQFVGPGVGGVLFAAARRLPFFADGLSFFVSALLVRTSVPGPVKDSTAQGERRTWYRDFRQGLTVFVRQPALKLLSANFGVLSFCQSMFFGLLVVYGRYSLHLSPAGYGLFLASAAVLGVIGAFFGGSLLRRFGPGRIILAGAAAAVISWATLAFTGNAVLAVFVFGLQEIGIAVANVGSVTTRQRLIPRELYGRVSSVHRVISAGLSPLGAIVGGVVASVADVRAAMFLAGVIEAVALVTMGPRLFRALKRSSLGHEHRPVLSL